LLSTKGAWKARKKREGKTKESAATTVTLFLNTIVIPYYSIMIRDSDPKIDIGSSIQHAILGEGDIIAIRWLVGGGGKGPSRKKELLTRYFGLICWDPAR
jgi:hypothetical protein